MKTLAYAACITLSLLAVAACSKKSADGDGSATAPASAPAAGGDVTAVLGNGPGLKPGLWQTTVVTTAMAGSMTTRMCLDEGLSKKFQDMGTSNPGKMDCTPQSATRNGGVIDVTTICKSEGLTVTNKMHMELTGDDTYHQVVEQSYDPPMMKPTTSTIDGKFMGACPAGMNAGDLDLGGVKINMYTHKAVVK